MELKRCARCGSFFASENEVCQTCNKKDNADVLKLRTFLEYQENELKDKDELSTYTGISIKNINRYLSMDEFSNINFSNSQEKNKKIEEKL